MEGKTVMDTGFSSSMGFLEDLPITNVIYSYDKFDQTKNILYQNNTINMLI